MIPQHNQVINALSQHGSEMDTVVVQQQQQQQLQQQYGNNASPPVFGSQMVDKNSSTPYTDATQVSELAKIVPRKHSCDAAVDFGCSVCVCV